MISFELSVGGRVDASLPIAELTVDHRLMRPTAVRVTVAGFELDELPAIKVGDRIEVKAVSAAAATTMFVGDVESLRLAEDAYERTLDVTAYDVLHRLTAGNRSRVFVKSKLSDMISAIAREQGLSVDVAATSEVYEHLWQYGESDYDFLMRLARMAGRIVTVEGQKLRVRTLPKASSKGKASHQVQGGPTPLEATVGRNVYGWAVRAGTGEAVKQVTVSGWDPKTAKSVTEATTTGPTLSDTTLTTVKTKAELQRVMVHESPSAAKEQGALLAETVVGPTRELVMTIEGDPKVVPGEVVSFGEVGDPFDGSYVVTAATHRFDASMGYVVDVESTSLSDRTLLGSILGDLGYPGVPAPEGAVPAVVSNISDPDKHGRVTLTYPWIDGKLESGWAKVVYPGLGKTKGLVVPPAVGDQVMVVFEHGSIDRPLVLGGGFVQTTDLAGTLDGSVATGADWLRERMAWRDGNGQMVELLAGGRNAIVLTTSSGTTITIDDKAKMVQVMSKEHKVLVDTKGDVEVKGKDITLQATNKLTLKAANIGVEATANVEVKGMKVAATGTTLLELKSNASAELSGAAMVSVKGALIKLN